MTVDGERRRGAGFGGIHGCGGQLGLRLVRAGVEGIGRKGTLLFQLVIFFSFGGLELDLFVLSSSRASPFSLSFT
jgi:hypothetical protein